MASADSWKGPFRQTDIKPIDRSQKNIDPSCSAMMTAKYYLYHVRFGNGNFIWVAEFNLAKGEIIPGTLKKCMESTEEWGSNRRLHLRPRNGKAPPSSNWTACTISFTLPTTTEALTMPWAMPLPTLPWGRGRKTRTVPSSITHRTVGWCVRTV